MFEMMGRFAPGIRGKTLHRRSAYASAAWPSGESCFTSSHASSLYRSWLYDDTRNGGTKARFACTSCHSPRSSVAQNFAYNASMRSISSKIERKSSILFPQNTMPPAASTERA